METIGSFCLFPCQRFIDRVSAPVAGAAFDLPGRNWVWDFWRKGGEEVGQGFGMQ